MRVEIRQRIGRFVADVYVYEAGNPVRVLTLIDGEPHWKEIEPGVEISPDLALVSLPTDVLEAIVREARIGGRADDLALDAIQDARATRDRLLSILERP